MIDVNAVTPTGDTDWAPLIDVSDIPIAQLRGGTNPLLEKSLDRLIQSLDDPNGVISAFASFISDT